ncbi:pre-mRNA-processing factor 39 [Plectosphaerella cucumerina]|uniref:Pre-mRNA-processing factor 39 n=1 Tax=Plectosphaerella cucumerina TaxID=40658 RepID=A0A8K0TEN6_9PEZI|nr:pre-mRNA-processing factor 39 [Plectosphaerella cucumerina]
MSDFDHYGASGEEDVEIKTIQAEVELDPDNFETWEKLIRACEGQEGGLNRNSSPQALASMRSAYDGFLAKFPLLFGYWKKYADLEFNIAGPESAELVYERGCASITNSVDLWTDYCSFKMETTHVPHLVRELFERGAAHVGLDFLAHPFWDKYLEYEERQEAEAQILAILRRIISIPMHQYARYYEKFRQLSHTRPVTELVDPETLTQIRAEVEAPYAGVQRQELEVERDIRGRIDALYYETFNNTQSETTKRWTYESEMKRPYFHVTELEYSQVINWRKYLDFEEAQGDYARIVFLYERCLVTCAFYDEFWFRYARWMSAQPGKEEEVRIIYQRACMMFVPISRPGIRLQFAYFEESCGRIDMARDIHASILIKLPDCIEAITSWAHLQRRQSGLEAAIDIYKTQIDSPEVDLFTKAALVAEWAFLLWKVKGSIEEARNVFLKNVQWYADSRLFWEKWVEFELQQPTSLETEEQHGKRVQQIFTELRSKSRLSASTKMELFEAYLGYLQQRGGKDAMKQFLQLDREIFGPASVAAADGASAAGKENGAAPGGLDESTRAKAEAKYLTFYQLHASAGAEGQGNAPFN